MDLLSKVLNRGKSVEKLPDASKHELLPPSAFLDTIQALNSISTTPNNGEDKENRPPSTSGPLSVHFNGCSGKDLPSTL